MNLFFINDRMKKLFIKGIDEESQKRICSSFIYLSIGWPIFWFLLIFCDIGKPVVTHVGEYYNGGDALVILLFSGIPIFIGYIAGVMSEMARVKK